MVRRPLWNESVGCARVSFEEITLHLSSKTLMEVKGNFHIFSFTNIARCFVNDTFIMLLNSTNHIEFAATTVVAVVVEA